MLGLNDKSEPEDEPTSTEGTGNDNEDWELDKELQQELEVNIIPQIYKIYRKNYV